jgi:hypothetical protein
LQQADVAWVIGIVFSFSALVLIGGLAIICFTKAFGVVFLGSGRHAFTHEIKEVSTPQLVPLYFIGAFIIAIGLFPNTFLNILIEPVQLFTNLQALPFISFQGQGAEILQSVGRSSWLLIAFVVVVWGIRKFIQQKHLRTQSPTWGCGYTASTPKLQYTASSFVKSYTKLFGLIFLIHKNEQELTGIFPSEARYETNPYDKIEKWLIDYPLTYLKLFLNRFRFVQNGKLQFYILYGILFILSVLSIPLIYEQIIRFIQFIKQL